MIRARAPVSGPIRARFAARSFASIGYRCIRNGLPTAGAATAGVKRSWGRSRAYASSAEPKGESKASSLDKFWTKISISAEKDGSGIELHTLCLDSKPIKTPKGNAITVPQAQMAQLLAQEWSVIAGKIKPYSLPLTSLVGRAIDLSQDPDERARVTDHLLPYLDTDTLLVYASDTECEGALRKAQNSRYPDIKLMAELFWGTRLSTLDGNVALYGNTQSGETKKIVTEWIESLDNWHLAALERATITAKSLIAGVMIITRQESVDEIANLVNLEIIHQTRLWGHVEDTHDVNHVDMRRALGSAFLLASVSGKDLRALQLGL